MLSENSVSTLGTQGLLYQKKKSLVHVVWYLSLTGYSYKPPVMHLNTAILYAIGNWRKVVYRADDIIW